VIWEQSSSRTIPKRRAAPRYSSSPQQGVIAEFHRIRVEIRRVIAEGDLVVAHNLITPSLEDRGMAGAETFRRRDANTVEYWDVRQAVPEPVANNNRMF
jgi:predicted SnoaL-like aldol condensation-catalyzing enzyme